MGALSIVLIFVLLAALTTSPGSALVTLTAQQVRLLAQQGATNVDYIRGVVTMNLPPELLARVRAEITLRRPVINTGFVANTNNDTASTDNINNNNNNDSPILPDVNNNEPILLKRKRRNSATSGGNPLNSDNLRTADFLSSGPFGDLGFGGGNWNFFHGPSGYGGGYGGGSHVTNDHPTGNGNLQSGDSRGYIKHTESGYSYGEHHQGPFGHNRFGHHQKPNCPRQTDQGSVYQYSNDPMTYPALPISDELFARSQPGSDLLFQTLLRQVVVPEDPPKIFVDSFLLKSNFTCKFTEDQVWSYQSVTFTGRCYPLVNFQEVPFFKTCLNRFCENCGGGSTTSSFFWGPRHPPSSNVCITDYKRISLWSYCEQLLPNRRIVRDRILVPSACTCTTVPCSYYHDGYHK